MIIKEMTLQVPVDSMEAFWVAQSIWNRESFECDGYLGTLQGRADDGDVVVSVHWRSREDLARFMEHDHDRIAALAGSVGLYDSLRVRIIDGGWNEETLPF